MTSITVITPAYNEAAIIEKNLTRLCEYLKNLEHLYDWNILVVNDGSKDGTRELADQFAAQHPKVNVHHHRINKNLGGALRTGFKFAKGDYIIVMDLDLSYAEDHIERLMEVAVAKDADIVIASPYMKGGKNTAVPLLRLALSKVVNRIMYLMVPNQKIHTFTGMVRAYKTSFIKRLNLKSNTYSIMPEIIYKGLILRARIEEIPAHLDWSFQKEVGNTRTSSIRIFRGIFAGLMSGFIFRPYAVFMTIGFTLLLLSLYVIGWIFINTFNAIPTISPEEFEFRGPFGAAIAKVFAERPYSFFVGGISLIVAFQFLSIGFLSLQNKRYFDELFHINSNLLSQSIDKSVEKDEERVE